MHRDATTGCRHATSAATKSDVATARTDRGVRAVERLVKKAGRGDVTNADHHHVTERSVVVEVEAEAVGATDSARTGEAIGMDGETDLVTTEQEDRVATVLDETTACRHATSVETSDHLPATVMADPAGDAPVRLPSATVVPLGAVVVGPSETSDRHRGAPITKEATTGAKVCSLS